MVGMKKGLLVVLMGLVLLVLCIVAVEWLVRGSVQPSVEVVPVAATSTASLPLPSSPFRRLIALSHPS